jgi:hypothetical protein
MARLAYVRTRATLSGCIGLTLQEIGDADGDAGPGNRFWTRLAFPDTYVESVRERA